MYWSKHHIACSKVPSSWLIKNIPCVHFQRLKCICDLNSVYRDAAVFQTGGINSINQSQSLIQGHNRALSLERFKLLNPKNLNKNKPRKLTLSHAIIKKLSRLNILSKTTRTLLRVICLYRKYLLSPWGSVLKQSGTKLVRSNLPASKPDIWLQQPKGNFCCGYIANQILPPFS